MSTGSPRFSPSPTQVLNHLKKERGRKRKVMSYVLVILEFPSLEM